MKPVKSEAARRSRTSCMLFGPEPGQRAEPGGFSPATMSVKSNPFFTDFLCSWLGSVANPTYSFSYRQTHVRVRDHGSQWSRTRTRTRARSHTAPPPVLVGRPHDSGRVLLRRRSLEAGGDVGEEGKEDTKPLLTFLCLSILKLLHGSVALNVWSFLSPAVWF